MTVNIINKFSSRNSIMCLMLESLDLVILDNSGKHDSKTKIVVKLFLKNLFQHFSIKKKLLKGTCR